MDFEADDYCRGPVLELVDTCARFCPSTVELPFSVVTATESALLSWHDLVGVAHVFCSSGFKAVNQDDVP
jgi:ABC-type cobalamin transport system permease subunit